MMKMGDANASIPTVQPVYGQPMWGSEPLAAALTSVLFVSQISLDNGAIASYNIRKRTVAVKGCRNVTKKDMKWNDAKPAMSVDPETYEVTADGVLMDIEPADKLPLGKVYNLF